MTVRFAFKTAKAAEDQEKTSLNRHALSGSRFTGRRVFVRFAWCLWLECRSPEAPNWVKAHLPKERFRSLATSDLFGGCTSGC